MKKNLTLDEFQKPTYSAWKLAAEETLKGAPFEKKLLTKTPEGIVVQPIYDGVAKDPGMPGFFPYVRGIEADSHGWQIAQDLSAGTADQYSENLKAALERGQQVISIKLDTACKLGKDADQVGINRVADDGLSITTVEDLEKAIEAGKFPKTPIYIEGGSAQLTVMGMVSAAMMKRGVELKRVQGGIDQDPIGMLLKTGSLPISFRLVCKQMHYIVFWCQKVMPKFQSVNVDASIYSNAGGTAVQELGYALATAYDYLRILRKGTGKLKLNTLAKKYRFTLAMGGDFFMNIAKIRALRLLWAMVLKECGADEEACKTYIHATTGTWNKSSLDIHVNMLRLTTEAASAVFGGVQSLNIDPFDITVRDPDEFSRRISQNLHIILRDECQFEKVMDPAGGSPYVESLTQQLAEKAYSLFQEVEAAGGMFKAIRAGTVQEAVAAAAAEKRKLLEQRRSNMVGVNAFANPLEAPLDRKSRRDMKLRKEIAEAASNARGFSDDSLRSLSTMQAAYEGATFGEIAASVRSLKPAGGMRCTPLSFTRAAAPFEDMRNAVWSAVKRPQVLLLNMGPVKQYKARADFSTGFFDVGGFEIISASGFKNVLEAADAAKSSPAEVVVICSTDDTYPELVPQLARAIKGGAPKKTLVLAGYPTDYVEAFKNAGVDEFIHIKANCYQINHAILKKLGIME